MTAKCHARMIQALEASCIPISTRLARLQTMVTYRMFTPVLSWIHL